MLNAIGMFIIFLFLGMPVTFAIGVLGFIFLLMRLGMPWAILVQKSLFTTQSSITLAIPLFIFAGNLTSNTDITSRLMRLANALTGHTYGSISQVSVVLSALMGDVSESAAADVVMECRILGPEMIRCRYAPGWSAAINCLFGLIVATIPPSMGLTLYGTVGEISIGCLFIAGFVPGFIVCISMMVATSRSTHCLGYKPDHEKPPSLREVGRTYTESIWALLFPVILIVLIRGGVVTPSESGALVILCAPAVGAFVYRELTWEKSREYLIDSVKDTSVITMALAFPGVFSYEVVYDQLSEDVTSFLVGMTSNPTVVLFLVIVMLIVCGMFMEITAITLIATPIPLPVIRQYGIDPVQFGTIIMTTVTMGCSTPPVDVALCTYPFITDCPVGETTKYSWPLSVAISGTLLIRISLSDPILFPPNLVYGPSMWPMGKFNGFTG